MSRLFGWSYPPGCSGPPEDPPERACNCGHSEVDHEGETDPPSGRCLVDGCACVDFAMEPRAHVDLWYAIKQAEAEEAAYAEMEARDK